MLERILVSQLQMNLMKISKKVRTKEYNLSIEKFFY